MRTKYSCGFDIRLALRAYELNSIKIINMLLGISFEGHI